MECEICKAKMNWKNEGSSQGWWCPICGWNLTTTYVEDIDLDMTEYSLYIKNESAIDKYKIKFVSETANVSYIIAKQMLAGKEVCILKAKAPQIKAVITKLQDLRIAFSVDPMFKY